jgi:large subunit ribosomal protein L31e
MPLSVIWISFVIFSSRRHRKSSDCFFALIHDQFRSLNLSSFISTFKKRAPRAVRAIKSFASEQMGTSDVRIDVALNRFLWAQGVRNVPKRVRVRLERHRNEDEEAKEQSYTVVTILNTADFTGLQTTNVAL